MIHIPLINKTIESKPSKETEERLKPILESIKTMSETPEWKAYLLGLKEIEKKKKKGKSQNGNKSQDGRVHKRL
jgi:uncharacterized Zn finger protein